jgi:hypothetical protein
MSINIQPKALFASSLFCFSQLPNTAHAQSGPISPEAAKAFLKENTPCVFAVGNIMQTDDISPFVYKGAVLCAWNGVSNAGTIREKKGCFAGMYDLNHGRYLPYDDGSRQVYHISESQCSPGAVALFYLKSKPLKIGGCPGSFVDQNRLGLQILYNEASVAPSILQWKLSDPECASIRAEAEKKKEQEAFSKLSDTERKRVLEANEVEKKRISQIAECWSFFGKWTVDKQTFASPRPKDSFRRDDPILQKHAIKPAKLGDGQCSISDAMNCAMLGGTWFFDNNKGSCSK